MAIRLNVFLQTRSILNLVFINTAVFVGLIILIEGGEVLVLLYQRGGAADRRIERPHREFDPELGWKNVPNVLIKDYYAPGIDVRINGQGFRDDGDIDVDMPSGTFRLLCLGDSFTFGNGVKAEDTWCARLSRLLPKVQTVNMGVGGYGLDQTYLHYKRDGVRLKHDFILVAVIADDLRRMLFDEFLGYSKPKLIMKDAELSASKPRPPSTWITRQTRNLLQELTLVRLGQKLLPAYREEKGVRVQEFVDLLAFLFEDLRQTANKRMAIRNRDFG